MQAPPPQTVVVLVIVLVVVVYMAGLPGRRTGPTFPRAADGRPRTGFAQADCPKCGGDVWVSPGFEDPCPHCGTKVAGCAHCGTPLAEGGPRFRAADGAGWLCPAHHADEVWRAEKLAELNAPEAAAPPPDTPRAKEVRGSVENRLRRARQQGKEDYETFTDAEALDFWKKRLRPADVPAAVREAAELYRRADPNRGWSWMGVFRVRAGGAGAFVVWCVAAGGGDGWLEVFDADGTPAGYGRTQDEVVFWRPKAAVRRSLFGERLDPELLDVRKRRS